MKSHITVQVLFKIKFVKVVVLCTVDLVEEIYRVPVILALYKAPLLTGHFSFKLLPNTFMLTQEL